MITSSPTNQNTVNSPPWLTPGVRLMLMSTLAYLGVNTCVKHLSDFPTHQIIFFRAIISLVITLGIIYKLGIRPVLGHNRPWLILRGLAGIGALYFYFYTLQRMPMASAVTIQYLNPIFVAIGAHFLLKERMKPQRWLYFLVSFCGVLLVKGIDVRITSTDLLMGVAGAICSGIAYTTIRKAGSSEHAMVIVLYFPLIAMPITGISCLYDWHMPQGYDWLWALALGIFTQLGQVWATTAVQKEPLNKVAYLNYVGIIYALIIGYLFYDEGYDLISGCGMALVILGVALNLIDQDKRRRLKVMVIRRQAGNQTK